MVRQHAEVEESGGERAGACRAADPRGATADPRGATDVEQLFLDNLGLIRSIVTFIGRRRRLRPAEIDEFAAHVHLKLIEDDYGVLRKFQGRSSLRSYLAVVIQRQFLDWRVSQWGKWRPSAAARHNGRTAILLEQLIVCQGMTFDEAHTTLERVHGITIAKAALESLYARLPMRPRRRFSGDEALHDLASAYGDPTRELIAESERSETARTSRALSAELGALAPEDLRLLKLKFADGLTVAAIADATSDDAKRLYRRIHRVLTDLRRRLLQRGISQADVLGSLGRTDLQLTGAWTSRE